MYIACNYKSKLVYMFGFVILGIIIWRCLEVTIHNTIIKIAVTTILVGLAIQVNTIYGPLSLKIDKEKIIARHLIGMEIIPLSTIVSINKVSYGPRYREVYILKTQKKKIYLNTKCYYNLLKGINFLKSEMRS